MGSDNAGKAAITVSTGATAKPSYLIACWQRVRVRRH